jgi:hypothetical protein
MDNAACRVALREVYLYSRGKSLRFQLDKKAGWAEWRYCIDVMAKRKVQPLPGIEPWPYSMFPVIVLTYYGLLILQAADPVAARSEARALIARTLDRKFESRLRHGCLSSSFYVVLSCVSRRSKTGLWKPMKKKNTSRLISLLLLPPPWDGRGTKHACKDQKCIQFWSEKLIGWNNLRDMDVNGKIILKWIWIK